MLLGGSAAYADSLQLTGAPNGINGPYNFTLTNASGTSSQQLICFSDANTISIGEKWDVTVFNISNVSSITGTFAGTTQEYNELGWLAGLLFAKPGNADIQDSIWAILGLGGPNAKLDASLLAGMPTGYQTTDLFYIPTTSLGCSTGVNCSGGIPQPFIGQVPEPSSLILLGAGLMGLIGLSLRKRLA